MTRSTWTAADMPDLTGRNAVVAGSNTGLGLETAAALAGRGARVVLAVRDTDKGATAAATIRSRHADDRPIDLLVNDAGVMFTPRSTSRSHDVELQRALWDRSAELTGVSYPI